MHSVALWQLQAILKRLGPFYLLTEEESQIELLLECMSLQGFFFL